MKFEGVKFAQLFKFCDEGALKAADKRTARLRLVMGSVCVRSRDAHSGVRAFGSAFLCLSVRRSFTRRRRMANRRS